MYSRLALTLAVVAALWIATACQAEDAAPASQAPAAAASDVAAPADDTVQAASSAASESDLTVDQQISYALGYATAMNLKNQGVELQSPDLFTAGFKHAFGQGEAKLTPQQMQVALGVFQQRMIQAQQAHMQQMQEQGKANAAAGKAFLDDNATKEGITTTDSGLQIKTLKEGDGPTPTKDSIVTINYEGRLIDGTVFDSSYERHDPLVYDPTKFNVIPGWVEGLQRMKQGGEYELYIPSDLAYGPQGRGPIPPSSTLIFKMQVLKVEPAAPTSDADTAADSSAPAAQPE